MSTPSVTIPFSVAMHAELLLVGDVAMRRAEYEAVRCTPGMVRYGAEALSERAKLHLEQLRAAIDAPERSAQLTLTEMRQELHTLQGLLLAAQTTLSVDDHSDSLSVAQARLTALIGSLDGEGVEA